MANGAAIGHFYFCKQTSFRLLGYCSFSSSLYTVLFSFLLLVGTTCSGASLSSKYCKKVGEQVVIDEQGCDLTAVNANICRGYCFTHSYRDPLRNNILAASPRCCRMLDVEMIEVRLNCGSEVRIVKIPSATQCDCIDCV